MKWNSKKYTWNYYYNKYSNLIKIIYIIIIYGQIYGSLNIIMNLKNYYRNDQPTLMLFYNGPNGYYVINQHHPKSRTIIR